MTYGWLYFYEKLKSQYLKQITSPFINPWLVHKFCLQFSQADACMFNPPSSTTLVFIVWIILFYFRLDNLLRWQVTGFFNKHIKIVSLNSTWQIAWHSVITCHHGGIMEARVVTCHFDTCWPMFCRRNVCPLLMLPHPGPPSPDQGCDRVSFLSYCQTEFSKKRRRKI